MTDLRARLTDTLQRHHLDRVDRRAWWCSCRADCTTTEGSYAAHIADVLLSLHGIAIMELPEPDMVGDFGHVWNPEAAKRYDGPIGTVQCRPDGRIEIRDDYEHDYAPAAVKTDAAVLLAAVNQAEDRVERTIANPRRIRCDD